MEQSNPYTPPQASLESPVSDMAARIDSLPVSDTWKRRFHAIDKAGGVTLPHLKTMSAVDRAGFSMINFLAFFFGPIYYIIKGMWKKGLAMFAVGVIAVFILLMILALIGMERFGNMIGIGVSVMFGMRANIDYYKFMVLGDDCWW